MLAIPSKRTPLRLIRSVAADVEAIFYVSALCACPIDMRAGRICIPVPGMSIRMPCASLMGIVALLRSISAAQAASPELERRDSEHPHDAIRLSSIQALLMAAQFSIEKIGASRAFQVAAAHMSPCPDSRECRRFLLVCPFSASSCFCACSKQDSSEAAKCPAKSNITCPMVALQADARAVALHAEHQGAGDHVRTAAEQDACLPTSSVLLSLALGLLGTPGVLLGALLGLLGRLCLLLGRLELLHLFPDGVHLHWVGCDRPARRDLLLLDLQCH